MNVAAYQPHQTYNTAPDMPGQGDLAIATAIHGLFILVAIIGLPFMKKPPLDIPNTIAIEFAVLDEASQTPRVDDDKAEEVKETPAPQAQPKQTAEAPPPLPKPMESPKDLVTEEEAILLDRAEDAVEKVKAQEEEKPEEKPKVEETAAPQAAPVPPVKPKPPVKPEEKPKEEPKSFDSVLKNLAPDAPDSVSPTPQADAKPEPAQGALANLGNSLTASEIDGVRQQLMSCWIMMAGARNAEDLIVSVKLTMNPDRTVRQAQLVDSGRYYRDPFYRAAADSAIRAVRNPNCSPLRLPPDKYETWKEFTINFNPSDML